MPAMEFTDAQPGSSRDVRLFLPHKDGAHMVLPPFRQRASHGDKLWIGDET